MFINVFKYFMIWLFEFFFVNYLIVFIEGILLFDVDGEVNRMVCIVGIRRLCYRRVNIRIKSCGEYRVYYMLLVL